MGDLADLGFGARLVYPFTAKNVQHPPGPLPLLLGHGIKFAGFFGGAVASSGRSLQLVRRTSIPYLDTSHLVPSDFVSDGYLFAGAKGVLVFVCLDSITVFWYGMVW